MRLQPDPESPAAIVVGKFARKGIDIPTLAAGVGVNKGTVYRWLAPKAPRRHASGSYIGGTGCGGIIPAKHHAGVLAYAGRVGVRVTARDLVDGRGAKNG